MNNMAVILLSALGGFFLGVFFYLGLYWTVKKGLSSNHPGILFASSFFVRTFVVVAGILIITRGVLNPLISCVLGILLSRFTVNFFSKKISVPDHLNS